MGPNPHRMPKRTWTRIPFACISTPDREYSAILHKKQLKKSRLLCLYSCTSIACLSSKDESYPQNVYNIVQIATVTAITAAVSLFAAGPLVATQAAHAQWW